MASGMFFKVDFDIAYSPDGIQPSPLARLRGAKLSVLIALGVHLNSHGNCWPSIKRLAKMTGYSIVHTRRAICELREMGYISSEKRTWDNSSKQTSNLYTVNSLFSFGKIRGITDDTPK